MTSVKISDIFRWAKKRFLTDKINLSICKKLYAAYTKRYRWHISKVIWQGRGNKRRFIMYDHYLELETLSRIGLSLVF